jgi:hypothetical protein
MRFQKVKIPAQIHSANYYIMMLFNEVQFRALRPRSGFLVRPSRYIVEWHGNEQDV